MALNLSNIQTNQNLTTLSPKPAPKNPSTFRTNRPIPIHSKPRSRRNPNTPKNRDSYSAKPCCIAYRVNSTLVRKPILSEIRPR